MRPIFNTTYKGVKQVKIYMWDLHHELVLFQKNRNCFCYVLENETEEDILGWNTPMLEPYRKGLFVSVKVQSIPMKVFKVRI